MKFADVQKMRPCAKIKEFDTEDENGVKSKVSFKVYPFKVDDKLKWEALRKESEVLKKAGKIEESKKIDEDSLMEMIKAILVDNFEDLPEDWYIKFPKPWMITLLKIAFTFEGVSEDQFDTLKKKNVETLTNQ